MCAVNYGSIHAEPSTVVYLSVVDVHADTIEAMSEVAEMLYQQYILTTGAKHLVVAGDAKTYLRLKELKQQYGDEVQWLLPFIGDWHVLYNYLMKVYFEAGLKDFARASGFRAETLTSLGTASNFKRIPMHFSCRCGTHYICTCSTFLFPIKHHYQRILYRELKHD